MAVYLYYQLQYYIASPNDTTTRMMWSQNNPAPFPINFSCAGRSFRPKPPVGNFRKLPHLGFCAAPTGCMALNHYSNLTASSRACTAQMHALGYSNETRCAFLKHGETVRPTVHTQRATHDVQECDGACACNSRRTPGSMQPAQCIALHAATTSATVRTARWPTTVNAEAVSRTVAHRHRPPHACSTR